MRPIDPGDDGFLDALYEATRLEEILAWGLAMDAARLFLGAQARTQRAGYAIQYPGAERWMLVTGGVHVGRLVLDATGRAWRIVDLSVMPAHRQRGLGTLVLHHVQGRAMRAETPVRLTVAASNPARRLYARLGFSVTSCDGEHLAMEWRPR
jgi:ribosomal protein S18 acetylase RimI-like enzyme